ncbi:MAG: NADH-quinone oxidoreductase subunit NuoF [Verrucomicrobia bacterium]|jgi:bidirectional [NiFe] hydrogenase diaphorase subunit|nr:NADH-quinone oxidoreductase subunit NuoF [Verrucomicrobiota bacterium]OQC66225.1 MAG: NADP-reducing hydrogenase subunit HndC [Verrucomicrobia bacterium ADurb.Bin006]MDI9381111.1 NADH-quinone oxidoreductase subunit NuoF [Verrucomicrobiota bacterium]NMD22504.1 NADH-quinone oxidoreductase subunit NuoF [Verrucomicrobiota bacterium]HNV00661.1 NADH-quinone oxidoreductase subunit NuoF [Verrucomicrobiota bacterium]
MDLADLLEIKEKELRTRKPIRLRCCLAAGCVSSNGQAVKESLDKAVQEAGLADEVEVRQVGCMRLCCEGPLVAVDPAGILYQKVAPEDAASIVAALKGGETQVKRGDLNHPFFTKQMSIVLENSGEIDPERIESYIAADGYQALNDALVEMKPKEVIDAILQSGLRGRGGAGYPTGLKWATVAKMQGSKKYVICNADEGDPGAFMDRSVLESDPHRLLEGMAIAAYAVGADQGFIYVRAEYPLAISRLHTAIKQAKQHGLLGSGVLEAAFTFNVEIRIGAGAFVCGEETALMASIEGERGTPRPRPPFPAERGLYAGPTLINNVETLANVPSIVRKGADWFAGIGTEKSKGTKVFALAGKITNTGLIEVPMGTSLRTIVEEMGAGAPDGNQVKAVQTGGPSGGCLPASQLDTPVDYESLQQLGSIMGSGGMIVMDQTTNMVDVARFFMEFCMDESCGKCTPCRAGTVQLHALLDRILRRQATARDLELLEELCDLVKHTSLCGLGQTAPNPVLSTLRFFRNEYLELLQPEIGAPAAFGTPPKPDVNPTG